MCVRLGSSRQSRVRSAAELGGLLPPFSPFGFGWGMRQVIQDWLFWFSTCVVIVQAQREYPGIAITVLVAVLFHKFLRRRAAVRSQAVQAKPRVKDQTQVTPRWRSLCTKDTQTDPEITRNFWGVVYHTPAKRR